MCWDKIVRPSLPETDPYTDSRHPIRYKRRIASNKSGLEKQEAKKYQGEDAEYMVVFAKEYLKTHPDINFFISGCPSVVLLL